MSATATPLKLAVTNYADNYGGINLIVPLHGL